MEKVTRREFLRTLAHGSTVVAVGLPVATLAKALESKVEAGLPLLFERCSPPPGEYSPLNIGEIVARTIRARQKELAESLTRHNSLLEKMAQRGSAAPGGRVLPEPEASEYEWKELGGFATISGRRPILRRR